MSTSPEKIKVLYLDDEEVNLFIFEELFKEQFDVTTTKSAEAALSLLMDENKGIQMVLTDLKMHPVGGMTFIARARDQGVKIPICVLSAFPKNQELENAIASGLISAFFSKPVDVELIQKSAEQLLTSLK